MSVSIYYQNVRGIKTKLHNIYNEISANDFDLIFFSETWLNSSVLNSEICDCNKYFVYRRDRCDINKSQGGGVLILVKNNLKSVMQCSWSTTTEDIWVTISQPNFKVHMCCCIYYALD